MPKPRKVTMPGEDAGTDNVAETTAVEETGSTESNVEEAIAAAQGGNARKIAKPRAVPPPAKLTRPDPDRSTKAAVNTKKQMTYDEAMKLRNAGQLKSAVLTENGWVPPSDREPPAGTKN